MSVDRLAARIGAPKVRRSLGFTLVELVVYCGLLSIFTAVFVFSLPSRDNKTLENLSSSAEQSGLVLSKLSTEIANSTSARLTIAEDGKGVGFPSAVDETHRSYAYDASGSLVWRAWVCYVLKGSVLDRFESSLAKPLVLDALPTFPGISAMAGGRVSLACPEVVEFSVASSKSALLVTLTVDVEGERIRNVSAMAPRN